MSLFLVPREVSTGQETTAVLHRSTEPITRADGKGSPTLGRGVFMITTVERLNNIAMLVRNCGGAQVKAGDEVANISLNRILAYVLSLILVG
jgi:hypothetical protein